MSFSELASNGGFHPAVDVDPIATKLIKFLNVSHSEEFRYELRASGLPFCPRCYSLANVLSKKLLPTTSMEFIDDATLSTGTTFHTVLQRWMGKAGVLVGDWKCESCGKIRKWREGAPKCKNKRCRSYRQEMTYEELFLRDPETGLTAHPDGLFYTPDRVLEGLEFKTIVQANLEELKKPYEMHLKYQAAAYAYLLKKVRGLDIKHFTFFYIARNLPQSHKIYYFKKHDSKKPLTILQNWSGKHTLIKMFRCEIDLSTIEDEFKKIKIVLKLQKKLGKTLLPRAVDEGWGLCESSKSNSARWCPLVDVCFSRRIEKKYKTERISKLPVLP